MPDQWHLLDEMEISHDIEYDELREFFWEAIEDLKKRYPRYKEFDYIRMGGPHGIFLCVYGLGKDAHDL